ncbi:N-6 DNA methylase [Elizabethkingia meningoseptica]|uniref:N-6 DNA methylase n=1 Tax=Elizabethkingia meningoseptica TaxID=238 RepID=UPI0038913A09
MSLSSLLETLNLSDKDGLYFYDDLHNEETDFLSIRLKETFLDYIKPDAFFCINNEPLILFIEQQRDLSILEKQIWNLNQTPTIFINENSQWIIKNGFKFLESTNRLEFLTKSKNILDFEYFELITGRSWEKYRKEFEEKNRVDHYLLKNIEDARNILINSSYGNLHPKIANSLIGRVIFIRYLIDRKVELNKYGITKKEDFYQILSSQEETYLFFQQVKDDFNGNLFPLEYEVNESRIFEKDKVNTKHLSIIVSLLKGDKINIDNSIEPSLFDVYDFSIIPIEFVSNVYEKFIGDDNQADSGAYYTPLFLVDYIQKETVVKYFKENPNEYNCTVLDPACGSGIFLVETLRQIISQYQKLNPLNIENEIEYNNYKEKLKSLLTDNIFGIDKDENAVTVAIFSLYITLLDNLKPKSIVGFEFPKLEGSNFFTNDFFDESDDFNSILREQHFQYILGNPPWKTKGHPKEKQQFEQYIEKRKKVEKSTLEIVHREIAEAFLVRVSDFNFTETAFIVVSKILYKLEKDGVFRKYFLNNFLMRQIVELSSVRHHIFNKSNDSAVAPASILFYRKENNIELLCKNIITHISLKPNIFFETFKLMVIEKYDVKEVAQKFFIDENWIWKVLVYGNVLDYYFIKRLKNNYSTIGQIISDKTKFAFGQGLKFKDGKKKINTVNYSNYKFIGSLKKKRNKKGELTDEHTNYGDYLKPFYIAENSFVNWDNREVGYFPEDNRIFKAPSLLITGGTSKNFKSVSSILYTDSLFKSSLTAIKSLDKDSIDYLKTFSSILNSSFFSYYIITTGSSAGIEREETHDEEKWNVPFNMSQDLINLYNSVESLSKQHYESEMNNDLIRIYLEETIDTLDSKVIELFEPSPKERSLIDYTNTITIPLLKGTKEEKSKISSRIKYKDDILKNYAQVFIDHFSKRFNSAGHYFEVEILWSEYVIMMKFNIVQYPSKEEDFIVYSKIDNKELIINITKLGFENLSDNLFLQKDLKGFEEDYFYIAKPNQYKSWHHALAYLDLSEFIEAFFKIDNGITNLNEDK